MEEEVANLDRYTRQASTALALSGVIRWDALWSDQQYGEKRWDALWSDQRDKHLQEMGTTSTSFTRMGDALRPLNLFVSLTDQVTLLVQSLARKD